MALRLIITTDMENSPPPHTRQIVQHLKGLPEWLADVGGSLGLYLGASAFTLIELAFFAAAMARSAAAAAVRCGWRSFLKERKKKDLSYTSESHVQPILVGNYLCVNRTGNLAGGGEGRISARR